MSQRRSAKPVAMSRKTGTSAATTASMASGCGEPRQAVERALQNKGSGVLVDDLGALCAAHVRSDQVALNGSRREPLVPEPDRERRQFREVACKRARGLGARTFGAIHVDWQSEDEARGMPLGGEREESL